jgi:hypothetical protein
LERQCLKANEIRCPYCRSVQHTLLPQVDGFPLIHGVNYINPQIPIRVNHQVEHHAYLNGYKIAECCYENAEGVKICSVKYGKDFAQTNKFYCLKHYSLINKKFLKEEAKKNKITQTASLVSGVLCQHVLLTGKNKGNNCGKPSCKNTEYCKTHIVKYNVVVENG